MYNGAGSAAEAATRPARTGSRQQRQTAGALEPEPDGLQWQTEATAAGQDRQQTAGALEEPEPAKLQQICSEAIKEGQQDRTGSRPAAAADHYIKQDQYKNAVCSDLQLCI